MKRAREFALGLLAVGAAAQFSWRIAPREFARDAWTANEATFCLLLLGCIAVLCWDRWVTMVCALLSGWQCMTIACSVAYMHTPWIHKEGESLCSERLNLPLGAIGGVVALIVAWRLYTDRGRRGRTD